MQKLNLKSEDFLRKYISFRKT